MRDKVVPIRRKNNGLVVWLILLVILLSVLLYVIIGRAKIHQVIVTGSTHYSKEQIMAMLNIHEDTTVLEVFVMGYSEQDYYAYIKDVQIKYESFNAIRIEVEEKKIICYMAYQGRYMALDKDGYVVGYEEERLDDLPVISGVEFEVAVLGQRLIEGEDMLRTLIEIHHLSQKYNVFFDQLHFTNGLTNDIIAYVGGIMVQLGDSYDLNRKLLDAHEALAQLPDYETGNLDLSSEKETYTFVRSLDVAYYVEYGERFLGMNKEDVITVLSPHKLKNVVVISDVFSANNQVGEQVNIDPVFVEIIHTILTYSDAYEVPIDRIGFKDSDPNSIRLTSHQIEILFGNPEEYDHKFEAIKEVLNIEETGVIGQLDVRTFKEAYELEKNVN